MTTNRSSPYRIYLLTFWLEAADDLANPETWRFRLEESQSGRRRGCIGVTALAAELVRTIADQEESSDVSL